MLLVCGVEQGRNLDVGVALGEAHIALISSVLFNLRL